MRQIFAVASPQCNRTRSACIILRGILLSGVVEKVVVRNHFKHHFRLSNTSYLADHTITQTKRDKETILHVSRI